MTEKLTEVKAGYLTLTGVPVDIEDVKQKVNNIVGVLETGQFLKMCNRIIVGTNSGAKIIEVEDDLAE